MYVQHKYCYKKFINKSLINLNLFTLQHFLSFYSVLPQVLIAYCARFIVNVY